MWTPPPVTFYPGRPSIYFMCSPTPPVCRVGLPMWRENTPPPTSTAFPLAQYLLRELMNFSLVKLLTSFEAPSSGLPLIYASGWRLFPPKGNSGKVSLPGWQNRNFYHPLETNRKGQKEPFAVFCERRRFPSLLSSSDKNQKKQNSTFFFAK